MLNKFKKLFVSILTVLFTFTAIKVPVMQH